MSTKDLENESAPAPKAPNKTDRLGTAKIGSLLAEFSIPAMISLAFGQFYNVISAIFLGIAVPTVGVAVTVLAYPVSMILHGLSVWAGQGGCALAALRMGEGKRHEVERILGNAAFLLLSFGVILCLLAIFFIDPILSIVGTPESMWEPTKMYFRVLICFTVFNLVGAGLNNFLRAAGEPRMALYTTVAGTAASILFNYLFVIVFGWGIPGSAIATVSGQGVTMLAVLWYFVIKKDAEFHLRLSCMKPDMAIVGKILAIGLPSFALQAAWAFVTVVLNQLINVYGSQDALGAESALAAFGAAQRTVGICLTPMIGISMGAQPMAGYSYGAKNWQRVLGILRYAITVAVSYGVFVCALCFFAAGPIVGLYSVTGATAEFAQMVLRNFTCVFFCVGLQIVGSSYFQSTGQPVKSTVLELSRQIIFLLPLYLTIPHMTDIFGLTSLQLVSLCVPIADVLSALTTLVFIVFEVRRFKRYLREEKELSAAA